ENPHLVAGRTRSAAVHHRPQPRQRGRAGDAGECRSRQAEPHGPGAPRRGGGRPDRPTRRLLIDRDLHPRRGGCGLRLRARPGGGAEPDRQQIRRAAQDRARQPWGDLRAGGDRLAADEPDSRPAVRVLERGTEVRGPGDEQGGPGQGPVALRRGRLRPRDRRVPRRLRVPWRRSDLQGLYGIRCRAQGRSAFGRGRAQVLRLLERGARRRRVRETPGALFVISLKLSRGLAGAALCILAVTGCSSSQDSDSKGEDSSAEDAGGKDGAQPGVEKVDPDDLVVKQDVRVPGSKENKVTVGVSSLEVDGKTMTLTLVVTPHFKSAADDDSISIYDSW